MAFKRTPYPLAVTSNSPFTREPDNHEATFLPYRFPSRPHFISVCGPGASSLHSGGSDAFPMRNPCPGSFALLPSRLALRTTSTDPLIKCWTFYIHVSVWAHVLLFLGYVLWKGTWCLLRKGQSVHSSCSTGVTFPLATSTVPFPPSGPQHLVSSVCLTQPSWWVWRKPISWFWFPSTWWLMTLIIFHVLIGYLKIFGELSIHTKWLYVDIHFLFPSALLSSLFSSLLPSFLPSSLSRAGLCVFCPTPVEQAHFP